MFGFGLWEILLVVGLLVVCFGASRTGKILGTGVRLKRQADTVKHQLGGAFSLRGLLQRFFRF
jgi:Sec-independent protein translocase protein TatA